MDPVTFNVHARRYVPDHLDNCETPCRYGDQWCSWDYLDSHDCCYTCNDLAAETLTQHLERAYLDLCRKRWLVDASMSGQEFERVQRELGEATIALIAHYKRST